MRIGKAVIGVLALAGAIGVTAYYTQQITWLPSWAKVLAEVLAAFFALIVNPVLLKLTGKNTGNQIQLLWLRYFSLVRVVAEVRATYRVNNVDRADCEFALEGAFDVPEFMRADDRLRATVVRQQRHVELEVRLVSPEPERTPSHVRDHRAVVNTAYVTLKVANLRPRELPEVLKLLDSTQSSALEPLSSKAAFRPGERKATVRVVGWLKDAREVHVELERLRDATSPVEYQVLDTALSAVHELPPQAFKDMRDAVVLYARRR